jgi:hypothetical protein
LTFQSAWFAVSCPGEFFDDVTINHVLLLESKWKKTARRKQSPASGCFLPAGLTTRGLNKAATPRGGESPVRAA